MSVAVTIRDVPRSVRDALSAFAAERGQSLQAYLLELLTRQAEFGRNLRVLDEIEQDLATGGGADTDAPGPARVLAEERSRPGGTDGAFHAA